ncbi:hypothetical protein [Clostridium estertheticum]|uniref:hypothetical protein n=1 Tax=Clostridium estertheticum TaxID=238834 RepID=UPI00209B68E4|nr:hypothetical protein [Clostridium estertheticum]
MVDADVIQPIPDPLDPKLLANIGRIGDLDIVELKIAKAPQHPIMRIIRSPLDNFFITFLLV